MSFGLSVVRRSLLLSTSTNALVLATTVQKMDLSARGARGAPGLEWVTAEPERFGRFIQSVAGGSGRRVVAVPGLGGADETLRTDLQLPTGAAMSAHRYPAGTFTRGVDELLDELPRSIDGYGGGRGPLVDNSAAFAAAQAADALPNGGEVLIAGGDRLGNYLVVRPGIHVRGTSSGISEFDASDTPGDAGLAEYVRPYATGPGTSTICFGDGSMQLRTNSLRDIQVSADRGDGTAAESAIEVQSAAHLWMENFGARGGTRTIRIRPTGGQAATIIDLSRFNVRNDNFGADVACVELERTGSDENYITGFSMSQGHISGPPEGMAVRAIASASSIVVYCNNLYADVKPWHGFEGVGGVVFVGNGSQIDPGCLGVPVFQFRFGQADPARVILGSWEIGGRSIKFADTIVIGGISGDVLTVTDWASGLIVDGHDVDCIGIDHSLGQTDMTGPKVDGLWFGSTPITIVEQLTSAEGDDAPGKTGTYRISSEQDVPAGTEIVIGKTVMIPNDTRDFSSSARILDPYLGGDIRLTDRLNPFDETTVLQKEATDVWRLVGANLKVASTENATSLTSGALRTPGGLAIGKDLVVGGHIEVYSDTGVLVAEWDGNSPTGGARITAHGPGLQDIRFDPKDGGAVVANGAGLRPYGLTQTNGTAGYPWTDLYVENTPHVVSDERLKHWLGDLPSHPDVEAYVRAGKRILAEMGLFQWNAAIERKAGSGEEARWHCGVKAQQAIQAFVDEGLEDDWVDSDRPTFRHAMFSYSTWDDVHETVFEDVEEDETYLAREQVGTEMRPVGPKGALVECPIFATIEKTQAVTKRRPAGEELSLAAGDRFMVRTSELLAFLLAVSAIVQARIEDRLVALEAAAA